jgi:hypothetical protein
MTKILIALRELLALSGASVAGTLDLPLATAMKCA